MHDDAYPWDNEPHTEREYLRNWKGMPSRFDWNNRPYMKHCQECKSCGYRWQAIDFTYRSFDKLNGKPGEVRTHNVCWNCYQCESNPMEVKKFWEKVDDDKPRQVEKKAGPSLKSIGSK